MSVNSHLEKIANGAVLRDIEKQSIQRSIETLRARLNLYFPNELETHLTFGSYTRGTILPRKYDMRSDIDYMVVFNDKEYKPQTYLNRLKRFVEFYYQRSEITQSHPTIMLNLNHIRFELVPAVNSLFYGYQIPSPSNQLESWISTTPNDFNKKLTEKNTNNFSLIKPLIRVMKYWNAKNSYVFPSYDLEQNIVNMSFYSCYSLRDYVYSAIDQLYISYLMPQWKIDAVGRLKKIKNLTQQYENDAMPLTAEVEIRKVIPNLE
ncbi:SMODS domain-containing nucleotidyltransferase [Serratia liquefaciens]|uniref:SMODS domain-containing nucleotidyltransferase n=1 Tax=Serratia liquefaciens TaxID=614 RepID=UPI00217C5DCF|nr:nucleotidyltransferase domain-containing protein [Serratia liquefaciens]CAI1685037.1 Nucleotidyltransferase domain [Serratia liquefaciens]